MKSIQKLSPNVRSLSLTLSFAVQALTVINPTAETVLIRIGARDVPLELDDADFYAPPASAVTLPVVGTDFALGFGLPALAQQPAGMPTTALVYFTADEMPPILSSVAISTLQGVMEIVPADGVVFETTLTGPINATIDNPSLNVTGAITATIDNPTLAVTGDVTATIDNPSLNVSGSTVAIAGPVDTVIQNANIEVVPAAGTTFDVDVQNAQLNANIVNATLPITGDVDANITNAQINANITNADIPVTGNVDANITNAQINANITNALLPVAGDVNANIVNASVAVTGTVDATITNASIPVTGDVNATIDNATLDVEVTGTVNIPIINAAGDILDSVIREELTILEQSIFSVSGGGLATANVVLTDGVVALTIANVHSGVGSIEVVGATSGIRYFFEPDIQVFTRQQVWTFPIFPGVDSAVDVTYFRITSGVVLRMEIYGHFITPPRATDERGAGIVSILTPDYIVIENEHYDFATTTTGGPFIRQTYTAPDDRITRIKSIYLSLDGTTAAGGYRAIIDMYSTALVITHRILDFRSLTVFSDTYITCDLVLPPGWELRNSTIKTDGASRRMSYFPYILSEPI